MNANHEPSGEYAAVSALSTSTSDATAMSVAAEGAGVTFGTIVAARVWAGVGLGVDGGVESTGDALGDGALELGVGAPDPVAGVGLEALGVTDGAVDDGGAAVATGVGVAPWPVSRTYIVRPDPPA